MLLSDAVRDVYATDASLYRVRPEAVVVPRNTFDIVSTVLFAREHRIPITMRGAGSSTAGQAVGSGIIIDTTKYMNKVIAVDPAGGYVVTEPGIPFDRLNAHLAGYGMRVPCAPSSSAYATAGGMIGNNASGARSVKYGDTRSHTRTLSLVLSDGSPVTTASLDIDSPELAAGAANPSLWGEIHRSLPRIITRESERIERFSVPIGKNSSGYALDRIITDGKFDVAPLIVGSEGTLAAVTQISFRLSPLPRYRATMLCFSTSREKSLTLAGKLRALEPSALEFMDASFLAMVTRHAPSTIRIPADAQAALLVEFEEESAVERDDKIRTARYIAVERTRLAASARTAVNAAECNALWRLRYAIAPLLNRRTDGRMAVPLIEDVAVAPELLPEFISRLCQLLDAAGLSGSYAVFGHAGDGNLHVRPLMDPRSSEDRAVMKKLLRETHALVEELGGTATGEHGDGRLRTAYLSHRFGALYGVFREVKALFDPKNMFNPGIIAAERPPLSDENMRFDGSYRARTLPVRLSPALLAAVRADAERCSGCGECRTFCPSFVSGNELSLPRGRLDLIRETMSEAAAHGTRFYQRRELASALYTDCLFCRRCESSCPAAIPAGLHAFTLKHDVVSRRGGYREDMLFARAGTVNRLGAIFPSLTNRALRSKLFRSMLAVIGVSKERSYPAFTSKRPWKYGRIIGSTNAARKIAIFHGCHGYAFDTDVVGAHIDLLTRAGAAVVVPRQECCGMPAFTAGMSRIVHRNMKRTIRSFAPFIRNGFEIITPCPSCAMMIRELWPAYADGRMADEAKRFSAKLVTLDDVIAGTLDRMQLKKLPIVYFTPCHERASHSTGHRERLEATPGIALTVIDDICCGSGGTFGMKAKNAPAYTALTAQLSERLTALGAATIASPCGMCREQLKAVTTARVVHPVEIYARALSKNR